MCKVHAGVRCGARGGGSPAQCSQLRVHSTPHPTFAFELYAAANVGFDFDCSLHTDVVFKRDELINIKRDDLLLEGNNM